MKDFSLDELRRINEAYSTMLTEAARIGKDGFDSLGFDKDGYDRFGKNIFGINRDGYDDEGYDILGFNKDGWNKEGYPSPRTNPEAYGLKPEEVDDWIKTEIDKRMIRGRNVLTQRKSLGKHSEGKYVDRVGNRRRPPMTPEQMEFQKKLKKFAADYRSDERKREIEQRRADREAYLASEEGQAETRAKKEHLSQMRKTDEYRAKNAEYQRDYERARRILDGKNRHHLTVDDVIWMTNNPVYKSLKAKRDAEENRKQEEELKRNHGCRIIDWRV